MSRVCCIGVGLALALAGSSALAFQEQGGAPPVAPAAPEAKPAPTTPAPGGAADPGASYSAPELDTGAGTEVRIPGLGRLGVLPKMDFGLELLYGANETRQPEAQAPELQQPNEDLTIRGTVKHNF